MTRVNLLLPLFELSIITNNSEVVQAAIRREYPGLPVSNVFWIDPVNHKQQAQSAHYECVVRVPNFKINFDQVTQNLLRVKTLEATISKLKTDLFNLVKEYQSLLLQKSQMPSKFQKFKEQPNKDFSEDVSVSIKIDERFKKNPSYEDQNSSDKELINAISELTRENIKLKDMLSFSQAHIEFLLKNGEEKSPEKKQSDK